VRYTRDSNRSNNKMVPDGWPFRPFLETQRTEECKQEV
jgi:hypothetical protein